MGNMQDDFPAASQAGQGMHQADAVGAATHTNHGDGRRRREEMVMLLRSNQRGEQWVRMVLCGHASIIPCAPV